MRGIKKHERDVLESLLIMPVQRIPRYQLLLKELLKNTWPDHPDYVFLGQALDKIQETAAYVNDRAKEAESQSKMVTLQHQIVGKNEVSPLRIQMTCDGQ
jgi:hypothetical protein